LLLGWCHKCIVCNESALLACDEVIVQPFDVLLYALLENGQLLARVVVYWVVVRDIKSSADVGTTRGMGEVVETFMLVFWPENKSTSGIDGSSS
jgi:hypothetical protein